MPRPLLTALALLALASGCTPHDDPSVKAPRPAVAEPVPDPVLDPAPDPVPEPEVKPKVAVVSIASANLSQDCPDEPEGAVPDGGSAQGDVPEEAPSAGDMAPDHLGRRAIGMPQPCVQSSMQVAFVGQGPLPAKVAVKEVRLIALASGEVLGKIATRKPTRWGTDGVYTAWDEMLEPDTDTQASYRLGVPNWAAMKALPVDAYGELFVFEADIEIDGERQTVRSPEVPREPEGNVVT